MRLAVDVAGEVLRGPAELEQHLLEVAALAGVHDDGVVVDAGADQALDLGGLQHLGEHRPVGRDQHQAVGRVLLDPQPAVAVHRVGDVDQQAVRDGVAAVREQGVDHLLGVVAGGARVPQAQRRQPVGVDVLRRTLELGERGDRDPAGLGGGVVHLEEQGLVGLDDEGAGRGIRHPVKRRRGVVGWAHPGRGTACRSARTRPGVERRQTGSTAAIRERAMVTIWAFVRSTARTRPALRSRGARSRWVERPSFSTQVTRTGSPSRVAMRRSSSAAAAVDAVAARWSAATTAAATSAVRGGAAGGGQPGRRRAGDRRGGQPAAVGVLGDGAEAGLAQRLEQLVGLGRGDHDAGGQPAQPERGRLRVPQERAQLGVVLAGDEAERGTDVHGAVPAGDVADEVLQRLRHRGGGVRAQPAERVLGRPAGVHRAAYRVRAEAVDRARPRDSWVASSRRSAATSWRSGPAGDGGQVGLQHQVGDRLREQRRQRLGHRARRRAGSG